MRVGVLRWFVPLLLCGIWAMPCAATGPEAALGVYTYSSQDLAVKINWRLEQIDVVVNGQKFVKLDSDADENRDNFGSDGTWPFLIVVRKDSSTDAYLQLTLLMERGALKRVGALYYERKMSDQRTQRWHVTLSRVFEMQFKPTS